MKNLFQAFLFKLRKDLTFRITLFIGLGLAVLMTVIYLLIDVGINALSDEGGKMAHLFCTGENLLITSFNPAQNFGIAIPINLISFIALEFTQGTIRNKIIAGNSKVKVYLGLYLSGLVFTIALISSYVLLCFGLASAIGGFHPHGNIAGGILSAGSITPEFIWKFVVLALLAYVTIATVTIFFVTLIRHIGPCIPIVIILIFACYLGATMINLFSGFGSDDNSLIKGLTVAMKVINPFYSIFVFDSVVVDEMTYEANLVIKWDSFFMEVGNNIVYTAAFLFFGMLIFKKRDIK